MANPPITIGPFTNVPAPGSPIASNWAQQITQYVVDRHAHGGSVVGPAGNYPAGTDFITVNVAAYPVARMVSMAYSALAVANTAGMDVTMTFNGTGVAAWRFALAETTTMSLARFGLSLPANVPATLTVRNTASTITLFADAVLNVFSWQAVPLA